MGSISILVSGNRFRQGDRIMSKTITDREKKKFSKSPGVLIAAANEELREPLARLLEEKHHCQVETVSRRRDVLPLLQGSSRYEAVLVDKGLLWDDEEFDDAPGMKLLKDIKQISPTTLIHTGGNPTLSKLALETGALCCEQHPFNLENLALQVCQAVEFQQRSREQQVLETLIEINSSLHNARNERELLDAILNGVHRFGFDRIRLYLLSEDRNYLEAVAGLGMGDDFNKARLPLKDCYYMKRLLEEGCPLVFNRKEAAAVPFEQLLDKAEVEEWAGVPMRLKGEIIGKLSVDNKRSRRLILQEDLGALEVCASQAATAIQNRRTTESLRRAAVEVTEQGDQESLLETITQQAMALVEASGCGIYALRASGKEARDQLIILKDRTRPHLEKRMMEVGEATAARLEESHRSYWIVDDYENWQGKAAVLSGENFAAVLEIKLTWKSRPIGVLYLDRPAGKRFTDEEGARLSLFAQHAASALVHTERNDNLERLLSSSPIGIIAVDVKGDIDRINDAALTILKRTKPEVMGTYVGQYFQERLEPRKIGRLLHENGGKFPNYRTAVVTSDGAVIPILHSSTFRYDSAGNRVGSIGFFEDLRPLQLLIEANDIVARASNPSDGLKDLAKRMASLLPHTFCRILLVDGANEKLIVEAAQFPLTDTDSPRRRNAAFEQPIVIADWEGLRKILDGKDKRLFRSSQGRISPFLRNYSKHLGLAELVQSLLVVPLKVDDKPVGLFEFGELRSDQPFTEQQTQFASSIAAITAALIHRIRSHDIENQAFRMMSSSESIEATLATICAQAKEIFKCSSATIWPYDVSRQRFIPRELVSDGISRHILNRFRKTEPSKRGITNTVRKQDWLGVRDISDPSYQFLTPHMRELLGSAGIKSFQGVHLQVGGETVGVLYISYSKVCEFDGEDRHPLERFGAYAALSLKNARSSEQLKREKAAAQAVARVSALGDLKGTLKSVCKEIVRLTDCHVAVLYPYDEVRDRLDSPPTFHGRVRYPNRMLRLTEVPPQALIRRLLDEKKTIVIENTLLRNSPLKKSRFTQDESILSCIVVPLRVADRKVGVMFVNYRHHRRFTGSEIDNIELIGRQAAIAVSNAQLYDRVNRQLDGQDNLLQLSGALLKPLSINKILKKAVSSVAQTFGTNFSNIVLLDEKQKPVFRAGSGWPNQMKGYIFPDNSQTGYTTQTRRAVYVPDYKSETRFPVSHIIKDKKISSGLSVPMFDQDKVVGALLIHSVEHRRFSDREKKLLQLMANHTAIAIQNAKRLKANERNRTHLRALNEAAKAITQSFGADRTKVLNNILEQAVACVLQRHQVDAILGTIQEYDENTKEMIFVGAYPHTEDSEAVLAKIKKRRSIERSKEVRIGVIGRTVETKTAQLVRDVSKDRDFMVFKWKEGSEITAPLMDGDKVLGVINVECKQVGAFDEEDLETLKALADLAVIALRNSQQFDQLKQIRGIIGSRALLHWMGEIVRAWSHTIQTIQGDANDSLTRLQKWVAPQGQDEHKKLRGLIGKFDPAFLRTLAYETIEPIWVKDLIADYVESLQGEYGDSVVIDYPNPIDEKVIIKASKARCNFAFENLAKNAIHAMEEARKSGRWEIIFRTEILADMKLKITISDNGPGIPKSIEERIREEKHIEKRPDESGMGIGLMLVRAMLASYDADLLLVHTSEEGTEFAIIVPYQILESGKPRP
jgi:PAS domain S-box-containing protein